MLQLVHAGECKLVTELDYDGVNEETLRTEQFIFICKFGYPLIFYRNPSRELYLEHHLEHFVFH